MLDYAVVVVSIIVSHSVYRGSMIIDQQSTIVQQVMSVFSRINDVSVFLLCLWKTLGGLIFERNTRSPKKDHLQVENSGGSQMGDRKKSKFRLKSELPVDKPSKDRLQRQKNITYLGTLLVTSRKYCNL